jgi:hypothetical protein
MRYSLSRWAYEDRLKSPLVTAELAPPWRSSWNHQLRVFLGPLVNQ